MEEIYKLETIEELITYINAVSADKLRPLLLVEFDRLVNYKNIKEWNELVRVCEALRIAGWGDNEPLEAIARRWVNGAFYTEIQNKYFEPKLNWGRRWGKLGDTFVIYEPNLDNEDYGIRKFASQRNKLPKSPIRFMRSGNFQSSVQALCDCLDVLRVAIIKGMRPELYGAGFSHVGIKLNFSHHDDKSPSVRYEYFHNEADVPKELQGAKNPGGMPAYYIRPRLEMGNLSKKDSELSFIATRHFTKEFGNLPLFEQKEILQADFLEIIDVLDGKLKKKKIKYDVRLLRQDMLKIFATW